jgi:hypothetical protein
MRVALLLCVVGCVPMQTSTSTSGSSSGMSAQPAPGGSPAGTGQNAPDNRDTGMPSHDPPAGTSTMIALSPPPGRNQDGALIGPGGPVSDVETDCGPKRDHCVRGSYFAQGGRGGLEPVYIFEGRFWTWEGKPASNDFAYPTAPATAENLANAREVAVFKPRWEHETNLLPRSEQEALIGGQWQKIAIGAVNPAAGTFDHHAGGANSGGFTYKFEQARVLLKWVKAKPE